MYRITWYKHANDTSGVVIHEPANFGNKIVEVNVDLSLEGLGIGTFEFSVNINNPAYRQAESIIHLIKITDSENKQVFKGRIAKITNKMDSSGNFVENILCEDEKAYLYDSTQSYLKPQIMTVGDFLRRVLNAHNSQVDAHKRIQLGRVTVKDDESVYRGLAYGKTAEVIKDKLLDRLGGYLILRESNGVLYLDYLAEYGETSNTPLQIQRNLKSAERDTDVSELMTRIVPLGQDIETSDEIEIGTDFSRPKVTIESVNDGKNYIEDTALVAKFGVLQGEVEFPNVTDKNVLKRRAEEYRKAQRLMLITWTAEVIELGLLDKRYEIIQLGNSYPIVNDYLYSKESLQVIQKKIDILNPQRIVVTIGSGKKTLSQYQLEYKGVQDTLETVKGRVADASNTVANLKTQTQSIEEKTASLEETTAVLPDLSLSVSSHTASIEEQAVMIGAQQNVIEKQEETLLKQQAKLDELEKIVQELQEKR